MDHATLIDKVVAIAEQAASAIMEIYQSDFSVTAKDDASPLTQADLNAHRVIAAGLKALTPDLPLLSEESAAADYAIRRGWSRYWLVDPLDGTKEFVSRNGEFTVNIALIENHRPVLGVVAVPARNQLYLGSVPERHAERRAGSTGTPLKTRQEPGGAGPLTVVVSRSHGGERLAEFIAALRTRFDAVEEVPLGSALKLCIVAEGEADLYPRLGPTSEWDIGAAQAVLEAAGGAVWTFDRERLDYNSKESLLNPEFVAVGDPDFDWWAHLPQPG